MDMSSINFPKLYKFPLIPLIPLKSGIHLLNGTKHKMDPVFPSKGQATGRAVEWRLSLHTNQTRRINQQLNG